ncbi:MAG: N-acetylmuramoyl-L-alanine amidase [Lachnospiraceae bacterium]|nr:N-acetylmuramoyl-L-alanine amidase [Lachnospiraceae bacterium]
MDERERQEIERETRRRKRIIKVYTLRFLVALAAIGLVLLLVLMVKGIFSLFKKGEPTEEVVVIEEEPSLTPEEEAMLEELKEQMKDREFVLILDAGHGGSDVGTGTPDYYEKDINMDLVWEMKEMLEYCGVTVILTRDGDVTMPLASRSAFANEHEEADRFVSVHCNFCEGDESVVGLECYYWEGSRIGEAYAQKIVDTAAESDRILVRGTKTDNFHVLRETKLPAVLIETGYLSNPEEKQKIYDPDYRLHLSFYLVKGIIEGFEE